jgi:hypothetical protein
MEKCTTNIEPFQGAKPTNLERFIWLLERAFYRLMWHFANGITYCGSNHCGFWLVKQQLKVVVSMRNS